MSSNVVIPDSISLPASVATVHSTRRHKLLAWPKNWSLNQRRTVIFALIAVILLTFYWMARRGGKPTAAGNPTAVRIETPAVGDLTEIVQAPGIVEPLNKVGISARVAARIAAIPFKQGDAVTKGNATANPPVPSSVLVRLDAADLQADLRSAEARRDSQKAQIKVAEAHLLSQEAQLEVTKIQLVDAQRDLAREQKLISTGQVSQTSLETAQRKVSELKAQYTASVAQQRADDISREAAIYNSEAADAETSRARDNLSYATILSPIDGIVTDVRAKEGELAMTGTMNNPGTMILEVADLSQMLLVAQIAESDIALVKPGMGATAYIQAYRDRTFRGTVRNVALVQTSEKDGSKFYKAEILLDTKGERIPCGLTADVDVETSRHKGVLKLPSQAILGRPVDELPTDIRDQCKALLDPKKTVTPAVYRVRNGKAVVTPVKVGPSDATHTIITAGVDASDKVIVGPFKVLDKLAHDAAVKDEKETIGSTKSASPAVTHPNDANATHSG